MKAELITVDVHYSQLVVFASVLEHPFNDWTEGHVAQGFAWRPGSASFRTLVEAGAHAVAVRVVDEAEAPGDDVVRAIEVPFEVPPHSGIEIGSVSSSVALKVPQGPFLLRCDFLRPSVGAVQHVNLIFSRGAPRFAIVRADPELSPPGKLITTARVAGQ